MNKVRKVRSDCKVGSFEKKHGIPRAIRNKEGRDVRSEARLKSRSEMETSAWRKGGW